MGVRSCSGMTSSPRFFRPRWSHKRRSGALPAPQSSTIPTRMPEGDQMRRLARAFPVKSRAALEELGRAINQWNPLEKERFYAQFGGSEVRESWYFQEIEGKPYVIAVVQGDNLEHGYRYLQTSDDDFSRWFREQIRELTGVDLTESPRGPRSERVYEMHR